MHTKETLEQAFQDHFAVKADLCVKSPGRINIIGEHTDYNNGFVMPAAIDKYIYVALSKRNDNTISLFSSDYNESYETTLGASTETAPDWSKYILGAAAIVNEKNNSLAGFNLYVVGDVPLGAGLSSSAAFSCATTFALNELFDAKIERIEIAKIGQRIEHEFIGLKCGLMDQFASVMGKNNHAIKLDCQDLSFEYVPIDWSAYEILLLNTNVKHTLASSAYNKRRESCEQGVAWVKEHDSSVKSLRDVTLAQLEEFVRPKSEDTYTKCKFVVEENQRLQQAAKALEENEIPTLGNLLYQAHWALSKEYEVSCAELDYLIEAAQKNDYVVGARMMGGGFGGCTINIIKKGRSQEFVDNIAPAYEQKFGFALSPIQINLGDGTSIL